MRDEAAQERTRERKAHVIYEKLWTAANEELNRAKKEWHKLQDQLTEVKMMEFAAGADEAFLLPEELLLLDEMNQKLEAAQKTIHFWNRRVEMLYQFKDKVSCFYSRLETDIELHKLRLDLSRHLLADQSATNDSSTGQRRVRLY